MNRLQKWVVEGVIKALFEGKPNFRFRLAMGQLNAYFRRWEMEENGVKSKLKSKTLWVNGLTVLASALAVLITPEAKLDARTVGFIGSALGIVNMILRYLTTQPIKEETQ